MSTKLTHLWFTPVDNLPTCPVCGERVDGVEAIERELRTIECAHRVRVIVFWDEVLGEFLASPVLP